MRHIANHLKEHGGAGLIIDYGYLSDAHHDTLQAVKHHNFHPVLKEPGEADITAHVDFPSLASIATDAGLAAHGPVTQGDFLARLGGGVRLEMLLKAAAPEQKEAIVSGFTRLVSTQAMGELFKVLAVVSDPRADVPGFLT